MINAFQNGLLAQVVWSETIPVWLPFALAVVISLVIPYLLGSINSAVLISRLLYHEDIREKGSGNGGLTNANRVYGKKFALMVLVGDMLKTAIAIFFVGLLFGMQYEKYGFSANAMTYLAGTACILGHIFPIYFKFKGGKGVLCTATMVLILSPIVFVIEILIFILLVAVTKYVSVASMTVGLLYPVVLDRALAFCGIKAINGLMTLLPVLVGLLILYCHRGNIIRLKERRENKFSFRKKQ